MMEKTVRMRKLELDQFGRKPNRQKKSEILTTSTFSCYKFDYLLVLVYRPVSTVPIIHSHITAETADTVRLASVEETSLCQCFRRHLVSKVGATE